jgi:hypothetical protein
MLGAPAGRLGVRQCNCRLIAFFMPSYSGIKRQLRPHLRCGTALQGLRLRIYPITAFQEISCKNLKPVFIHNFGKESQVRIKVVWCATILMRHGGGVPWRMRDCFRGTTCFWGSYPPVFGRLPIGQVPPAFPNPWIFSISWVFPAYPICFPSLSFPLQPFPFGHSQCL